MVMVQLRNPQGPSSSSSSQSGHLFPISDRSCSCLFRFCLFAFGPGPDTQLERSGLLISLSTEPFCYHIRRLSFLLWPIVECLSLPCSQSVLRMHCFVVFLPSGSTLWTSRPNADPTGVAFVSTPALICCSFPLAAIKELCQCSFLVSFRFLLIWNNLPVDESPSRGVNCLVMQ